MIKIRNIGDITKRHFSDPDVQRARTILKSEPAIAERYELRQKIADGRGREYGTKLFSLRDRQSGEFVCAKVHFKKGDRYAISHFEEAYLRRISIGENPYLIEVYDFAVLGGDNGHPVLFMELAVDNLEGVIEDLKGNGNIDLADILKIGTSIAYAIEPIHEARGGKALANLGLKPAHVVFMQDGSVKLCDSFETARRVGVTTLLTGIPEYAAPETKDSRYKPHPTADIYSFGMVLFEMATLTNLSADSNEETWERRKQDLPWLKSQFAKVGNEYLREVTGGCLQPNPVNRYQRMAEVRQKLELAESIKK